ncbi:MAG: glycoside hydrolase family 27 protein [Candidatus Aminicenantes bacterium]|nr:glycoside hydrolase family 27 protein [Candidatus Aminicenantes bacterium]
MRKFIFIFILFIGFNFIFPQKFKDLAKTPPMGWNSWNKFGCDINENLIKEIADAMVKNGMKDAGYEYIVIDDCWQIARDKQGNIIADPKRFPSGIKALADYIHSKGLKFGLYSDAGTYTCQKRPGSRGYEYQDARTYASWGVDYLKYDWCFHGKQNSEASYKLMRNALYAAGRPIVISICEWGTTKPWLWARDIGHLWRTTEDIQDCWDCINDWGGIGWTLILDKQSGLEQYAGPGHWNDPDMLEVGNGGMSDKEYRAHFSMWCMLSAPLMAGNDIRNMSESIKNILTNKEVIALDQDPLGKQAYKYGDFGDYEIWVKFLMDKELAIAFLNRGDRSINIIVKWRNILRKTGLEKNSYKLKDLWKHKIIGDTKSIFKAKIPSHDILLLRLKRII